MSEESDLVSEIRAGNKTLESLIAHLEGKHVLNSDWSNTASAVIEGLPEVWKPIDVRLLDYVLYEIRYDLLDETLRRGLIKSASKNLDYEDDDTKYWHSQVISCLLGEDEFCLKVIGNHDHSLKAFDELIGRHQGSPESRMKIVERVLNECNVDGDVYRRLFGIEGIDRKKYFDNVFVHLRDNPDDVNTTLTLFYALEFRLNLVESNEVENNSPISIEGNDQIGFQFNWESFVFSFSEDDIDVILTGFSLLASSRFDLGGLTNELIIAAKVLKAVKETNFSHATRIADLPDYLQNIVIHVDKIFDSENNYSLDYILDSCKVLLEAGIVTESKIFEKLSAYIDTFQLSDQLLFAEIVNVEDLGEWLKGAESIFGEENYGRLLDSYNVLVLRAFTSNQNLPLLERLNLSRDFNDSQRDIIVDYTLEKIDDPKFLLFNIKVWDKLFEELSPNQKDAIEARLLKALASDDYTPDDYTKIVEFFLKRFWLPTKENLDLRFVDALINKISGYRHSSNKVAANMLVSVLRDLIEGKSFGAKLEQGGVAFRGPEEGFVISPKLKERLGDNLSNYFGLAELLDQSTIVDTINDGSWDPHTIAGTLSDRELFKDHWVRISKQSKGSKDFISNVVNVIDSESRIYLISCILTNPKMYKLNEKAIEDLTESWIKISVKEGDQLSDVWETETALLYGSSTFANNWRSGLQLKIDAFKVVNTELTIRDVARFTQEIFCEAIANDTSFRMSGNLVRAARRFFGV